MTSIKNLEPSLIKQLKSSIIIIDWKQCVAELVLNSLDAEANAIAVRVNPTNLRIQVIDNGKGISFKDLESVAVKHMTSKCQCLEDLSNLKTYGFRGESLSCISNLSKRLTIVSKCRNNQKTFSKTIERGVKMVEVRERASFGTTVTVEGFLDDYPVRKRCIKPEVELEGIKKFLYSLIIIKNNVSFTLRNDLTGEMLVNSRKHANTIEAFHSIHPEVNDNFVLFKVTKKNVKVEGLIHKERANKNFSYLYVNRKPAHIPRLFSLIESLLKPQKQGKQKLYPTFIINIKIPYTELDLLAENSSIGFKNWDIVIKCIRKLIETFLGQKQIKQTLPQKPLKTSCSVSEIKGTVKVKGIKRKKTSSPLLLQKATKEPLFKDIATIGYNDLVTKLCDLNPNHIEAEENPKASQVISFTGKEFYTQNNHLPKINKTNFEPLPLNIEINNLNDKPSKIKHHEDEEEGKNWLLNKYLNQNNVEFEEHRLKSPLTNFTIDPFNSKTFEETKDLNQSYYFTPGYKKGLKSPKILKKNTCFNFESGLDSKIPFFDQICKKREVFDKTKDSGWKSHYAEKSKFSFEPVRTSTQKNKKEEEGNFLLSTVQFNSLNESVNCENFPLNDTNQDWLKEVDMYGQPFYINKRSGMPTYLSPKLKNPADFKFKKRSEFVPKGLSPLLISPEPVSQVLSVNAKDKLHRAILDSYKDELRFVKWEKYLTDTGQSLTANQEIVFSDFESFFEAIYRGKAAYYVNNWIEIHEDNVEFKQGIKFNENLFQNLKVIGQCDKKFIVAFDAESNLLVIVDQHAAHERVRLEDLMTYYNRSKHACNVRLCIGNNDIELLKRSGQYFDSQGFEFEFFRNGILVKAVPLCIGKKIKTDNELLEIIEEFLQDVLDKLKQGEVLVGTHPLITNILNMEACRGAVKFGDEINFGHCVELLERLALCKLPFQCAHGRPTLLPLLYLNNTEKRYTKIDFSKLT